MYSTFAGVLTEDENGDRFEYDSVYLANEKAEYKQLIAKRSTILNE
ncbi:MAG: hypothetical protein ACRDD6_04240 [Tannerellaceae bacterium]